MLGDKMNKNKKTILLIGWFYPPSVGGVETIMVSLNKYLQNNNYNVVVLTSPSEGHPEVEKNGSSEILRKEFINPKKHCEEKKLISGFTQIVDKYKPDLIHFHNGSFPFSNSIEKVITIFNLAKKHRIPIIEHSHGPQYHDIYATGAARDLAWDDVICNSNFVKNSWQFLGSHAKNLSVVYNGINLSPYKKPKKNSELLKLKAKNIKLIFFPARDVKIDTGEVILRKNFLFVLEGLKELKKRGIENFMLVTISYENINNYAVKKSLNRLENLIKEYDLSGKVVKIPSIPIAEMPSYYSACDIVCVPSLYEAFGLVFVESMASGKITIGPDQGGPKEIIHHEVDGFLVNPYRVEELTDVLEKIIKNEKLSESISQQAIKRADYFSDQRMCQEIEKIYLKYI
jgi:glycosyltransferase involved in cell wall biosynthesis